MCRNVFGNDASAVVAEPGSAGSDELQPTRCAVTATAAMRTVIERLVHRGTLPGIRIMP
jgi:hypothetical protein